jgi:hypothetical protein
MCALCESAPAQPVTVFNSRHVRVVAPDLLCGRCAGRGVAEVATARAQAGLPDITPLLLDFQGADGSGGSPVGAGADPQAAEIAAAGVAAEAAAAGASKLQALNDADGDDSAAALSAVAVPLLAGGAAAGEGRGGAWAQQRGTSDGGSDAPGKTPPLPPPPPPPPAAVGHSSKRPGDVGYLPPVPFLDQFVAVLTLRLRLQCTRSSLFSLLLALVGVLLLTLLGSSRAPVTLTRCATGFYTNNLSTALCDRAQYAEWMTGAVRRT